MGEEKTEKKENLEELFSNLEEVIRELEEENGSLEKSFDLYNRGMVLLKKCNTAIDEVEKKVLILDEDGETHEF
ncbi:exodeoxyribonuclease VII small subunit [Ruminococcus sp. CLA-AA-H200]|uniref:Exodeoxyribonuclease 7 small subunit n=1 Tax=Ruminococcus turbiniformis TaxID=2881258 RepID=A0ABS8FTU5_9FIRM|nr:exodeoxyribonuclease VII small subunit [Ruminococcus turbiniformis]MCC2253473.1 exodeoxyribonuclease VII small subunit [Ruminococcus turbiniformis]